MAESKRTFHSGKLNRDLDDRIIPPGEYRDALNISVGRSEGADVGAIENLKGNHAVTDIIDNGTTIGNVRDPHTDNFYWFNVENEGTEDETSSVYEYNVRTGETTLLLRDRNIRNAPPPTCVPEWSTRITDGNSVFGVAPDFPDFPRIPIAQCLDPTASNHYTGSDRAYHDQSLCTYVIAGCTDPDAENYNPAANSDNGSCIYAPGPDYTFAMAMISCSVAADGLVTVTAGDTTITGLEWSADGVTYGTSGITFGTTVTTDTTRTINVRFMVPTTTDPNTGRPIYGNSGQTLTDQCLSQQAYTPSGNVWTIDFVNGTAPANTTVSGGATGIVGTEGTTLTHGDPGVNLPSFTISENAGWTFASATLDPNRFSLSSNNVNFPVSAVIHGDPFDVTSFRVQITSITFPNTALDASATVTATWALQAGDLVEFDGFSSASAGMSGCDDIEVSFEGNVIDGGTDTGDSVINGAIAAGTITGGRVTGDVTGATAPTFAFTGTTFTVTFSDRTPEVPDPFDTAVDGVNWTIELDVTAPSGFTNTGVTVNPQCTILQDGKQPETYTVTFTSIVPTNVENLGVVGGATINGLPGTTGGPFVFRIGAADGFELNGDATGTVTPASGTATFDVDNATANEVTISNVVIGAANETFEINWDVTAVMTESTDTTLTFRAIAPTRTTLGDRGFFGNNIIKTALTDYTWTFSAPAGSTQNFLFEDGTYPTTTLGYVRDNGFVDEGIQGTFIAEHPPIAVQSATGGWSDYDPGVDFFGNGNSQLFGVGAAEWPSEDGTVTIHWPGADLQEPPIEDQAYLYYLHTNGINPPPSINPGTTDARFVCAGIWYDPAPFLFTSVFTGQTTELYPVTALSYSIGQYAEISVVSIPANTVENLGGPFLTTDFACDLSLQPSRRQLAVDNATLTPVTDADGNHVRNGQNGAFNDVPSTVSGLRQGPLFGAFLGGRNSSGTGWSESGGARIENWPADWPIPSGYNGPVEADD